MRKNSQDQDQDHWHETSSDQRIQTQIQIPIHGSVHEINGSSIDNIDVVDSDASISRSLSTSPDEWKDDGRLFPHYSLYCEGHHRPVLRGALHLILTIFLPFGIWHFQLEAKNSSTGQMVGSIYVLTNLFCYGISAAYHIGNWSVRMEILLQKLDHCGISILSVGTTLPTAVLLLDDHVAVVFVATSISLGVWSCLRIFQGRPSMLRQMIVAANFVPFL